MTAVEWLADKLNNDFGNNDFLISYANEISQAKDLEKRQIIESARYYFHERGKLTPEQYYIETYENE